AVFGLARVRLRTGDRAGAVQALESVPDSSSRHVAAQLGAVQAVLLDHDSATEESELRVAAARVERLPLDPDTDGQVRSTLLAAAVAVAGNGAPTSYDGPFLGTTWDERELRLALESCLRTRARLASDPDVRIALVDRANATRPRTWL
ncbi:MAG TPA: tetratricopeptide repeat protein, partial [Pseudonocardia sp.]|nr:tetratricopeptide repeat protein [Pseudonocardia sp.]